MTERSAMMEHQMMKQGGMIGGGAK